MTSALHSYRYLGQSALVPTEGLWLAADAQEDVDPFFFRAFVEHPIQAAQSLLAISEVAQARYFDPGAAAAALDPVATSNESVLRFESFSGCNGVYARLDLLAEGLELDRSGSGTTNVDLNFSLRHALAGVGDGDPLRLTVGVDSLEAETMAGRIVERKVPLPERWLRGFANVALVSSEMTKTAELDRVAAVRALRELPTHSSGGRPFGSATTAEAVVQTVEGYLAEIEAIPKDLHAILQVLEVACSVTNTSVRETQATATLNDSAVGNSKRAKLARSILDFGSPVEAA